MPATAEMSNPRAQPPREEEENVGRANRNENTPAPGRMAQARRHICHSSLPDVDHRDWFDAIWPWGRSAERRRYRALTTNTIQACARPAAGLRIGVLGEGCCGLLDLIKSGNV